MVPRISLFVIAAVLLGAHYLRAGNLAMVALCLATPALFLYQKRWSLLVLQALAYAAAGNWMAVAVQLVQMRQQSGEPWTAAAIILGTVALLTALSGLQLNSRVLKEKYPQK